MSSHMTPQVAHETITMQRKASLATLLGGTAWILGTLQYVLAQIFVAAAWSTPYSFDWELHQRPGQHLVWTIRRAARQPGVRLFPST